MFQYTAGRALALNNHNQFKIDLSGFKANSLHNGYDLNIFNIKAEVASSNEVYSLIGSRSKLAMLLRRKLHLYKSTHIIERDFCFNENFFQIKKAAYLDGYWQSYHYPKSCEIYIRDDFKFRNPPIGQNLEILDRINSSNSVSIHVRRGDYITNPTFNSVHGFVGIGYYTKAIQQIVERIEFPNYFIFSDDIEWVKSNLRINKNVFYISHNLGRDSFEDMRLMSMCKHNVIANSSFSWWAAWLNTNPNKVVIAPANWFADRLAVPSYENFICSLLPDDWIIL